ncbi:unnamed protein product [Nezara viridula]|uniref:Neuropeptide n=2 Tax=Nezara viridula TaxID=85310 RepID=A0A3S5HJR9_NEZVI|nr:neuropeptide precursor [Nezara viridula]CAH1402485.1 unnamed protein product [Nezara viridula]
MWVKVLLAWLLAALALVAASSDWSQSSSSHLYSPLLQDDDWRGKRTGPSLSVANPIEVLRNRLLLEIARRRLQKQGGQAEQNREFLKNIGKRHTMPYRSFDRRFLDSSDYRLSSGEWETP